MPTKSSRQPQSGGLFGGFPVIGARCARGWLFPCEGCWLISPVVVNLLSGVHLQFAFV